MKLLSRPFLLVAASFALGTTMVTAHAQTLGGGPPLVLALNSTLNISGSSPSLTGPGSAYALSSNTAAVSAGSGATTANSSASMNYSFTVAGVWTSYNEAPPSTIGVTFSLTDDAYISWFLGGYNPADPNGQVAGSSSVGEASNGFSIVQGTSTNSGSNDEHPTGYPYNTTVSLSASWYTNYGTGFNPNISYTETALVIYTGTSQSIATYTAPAHFSWSDMAFAAATQTCAIVSSDPA